MSNIKQTMTRTAGKAGFLLKKYSPEILTGAGIVGGVTAAVMGAKATLKVEPIIDKLNEDLQKAKDVRDREDVEEYGKREYAQDAAIVYTRSALSFAKLYGPAVSVGVISISCIIGAHGIMRKRHAAALAAYVAVEKSFSEYRSRVEAIVGEEKSKELRYGIDDVEVVDEETGEKTTKKDISTVGHSQYARIFDEYNSNWNKNPEFNMMFLKSQQNYFNDLLLSRGHVFLNEVYEALGFPHSSAGSICGWVLGHRGDDFIDFGMFNVESDRARDFVNGYEASIVLDFNVDGLIWDLI